jgi:hypothetical protein
MHALSLLLAFPTLFSSRGPGARLVPVCWERVMFLHTYCTCRARIRGNCRVGWTLVGQGRGGGLASTGKSCFSLFSCDSDFFMRSFLPFVFVPSFPGRLRPVERPRKHVSVCLSVVLGGRFCVPVGNLYFSVNGPNNGLGTQGCRSQVASYLSLHVVQPPAVVHSQRDMTRSVMS